MAKQARYSSLDSNTPAERAARSAKPAPTLKRRGIVTCHHCGRGWEDLKDGFPVRMAKAGWGIGQVGSCLINVCPDCIGAAT